MSRHVSHAENMKWKSLDCSWNLKTAPETSERHLKPQKGSWNLRTAHEISRLLLKPQNGIWNLKRVPENSGTLMKPQNRYWNLRFLKPQNRSWNLKTAHVESNVGNIVPYRTGVRKNDILGTACDHTPYRHYCHGSLNDIFFGSDSIRQAVTMWTWPFLGRWR